MSLVLTVSFRSFSAGNLYSREVQVDGEQVAVQVQDTPGVEVRSPRSQIAHNPLVHLPHHPVHWTLVTTACNQSVLFVKRFCSPSHFTMRIQ